MKSLMAVAGSAGFSVLLAGIAWSAVLGQTAASSLPAAQPTGPALTTAAPQSLPAHKAAAQGVKVTWAAGVLTIGAEDASLNQILREVSRQTGMKVTGGVAEERVFGTYGPGSPDTVLASLLTGTGSNMILKDSSGDSPMELMLTPRLGRPSAPSPSSYAEETTPQRTDFPDRGPVRIRSLPANKGQLQRFDPPPATPENLGIGNATVPDQPAPNAQTATDPDSSGAAKTPQEIYDQLMKLQQQKSADGGPPQ